MLKGIFGRSKYAKSRRFLIDEYTDDIRNNPSDINAYIYRGEEHMYNKDYDKAFIDFSSAIDIDPKDPRGYCSRGDLYIEKKAYQSAIGDLSRAISLDQRMYTAYCSLGLAYFKLNKFKEAHDCLTKAIKLNPNDALSYHLRSSVCFALNMHDESKADFQIAMMPEIHRCTLRPTEILSNGWPTEAPTSMQGTMKETPRFMKRQ